MNTSRLLLAEIVELPLESLSDEKTLEAVGLDSLALAEFITRVEDRIGVSLDAVELSEILVPGARVGDFCSFVDQQVAALATEG